MFACAQNEEKAVKLRSTPLAVQVAWFLLGALLLSFDICILTITAAGLLFWSGRQLYQRLRIAMCCLKSRSSAMQRGENAKPCFSFDALV
ncbi:MAG: hypothetical protein PVH32_08470 [Chromatiales bacterium]|jgi:hypothetical protein